MDEHLAAEVDSAFPTDNIVTTSSYQKLPFGLVMWTVKVHSPSDWRQVAQWDRGITFGYKRAWAAAAVATEAYVRTLDQQRDLLWEVIDEDDGEIW